MALKEQKILLRSGDLLEWEIADPILMKGEVAFIDDIYKLKIGNGEDPFSELPILNDDGLLQQAVYQLQIDKADRTELFSGSYIDLTDVPSEFNPSAHTHTINDVTDLQSNLDGKEPTFTKNTAFNKNFGAASGTVCEGDDSRLTNSREWTASTISQAEAENGTATTRRAFTAQRVRQAIVSWWQSLDIIGKGDNQVPTNQDIREKYDVQSLISVEPTLSLDFSKNVYSVYEP